MNLFRTLSRPAYLGLMYCALAGVAVHAAEGTCERATAARVMTGASIREEPGGIALASADAADPATGAYERAIRISMPADAMAIAARSARPAIASAAPDAKAIPSFVREEPGGIVLASADAADPAAGAYEQAIRISMPADAMAVAARSARPAIPSFQSAAINPMLGDF